MPRHRAAAAAVASSVWSAGLTLAAVPIYLSKLGIEAYGLIGFFVTAQAVLQVLDLGLAPAINREVARNIATGDLDSARVLVRTLGCIYWVSAPFIALGFYLASPAIATDWLNAKSLPTAEVSEAVTLIGLLIAARWPALIYQSVLIGARELGVVSVLGAVMNTVSVGSAVAVITYIAPLPQALFAAQAIVSVVHALIAGALAWRVLGGRRGAAAAVSRLQGLWRFSAGMGGVTLTSIVLTQLDKALLSRMLSLPAFGEYMLAVSIVGGLSVLFLPLFNTIFPDYSARIARGESDALAARYRADTRLFAILYLPVVFALGTYAHDLVWIWTGQQDTAGAVAPIVMLLCIGTGINGLMHFPYSLQLAHGLVGIPLLINAVLLVVAAPLIVALAVSFGGLGGAMAWAGLQAAYLFFGTYLTHRRLSVGSGMSWLLEGVVLPAALAAATAAALRPIVDLSAPGSIGRIGAIASSVLLSTLVCALVLRDTRAHLIGQVRRIIYTVTH